MPLSIVDTNRQRLFELKIPPLSERIGSIGDKKRQAALESAAANADEHFILSARGSVYKTDVGTSDSPGMYVVEGLNRWREEENSPVVPFRTAFTPFRQRSPVLIMNISIGQSDITSQVPCLDNFKVIYVFGQNFGNVGINGIVLLGRDGDLQRDGVEQIRDFFNRNRVSKKLDPIRISVSNNGYLVYLTGLQIGAIDPHFHILPFAMSGILLDVETDDPPNINPDSVVVTGGNLEDPSLYKALASVKPKPLKAADVATSVSKNAKVINPTSGRSDAVEAEKISADNDPTPARRNVEDNLLGDVGNAEASITQKLLTNTPISSDDREYLEAKEADVRAQEKLKKTQVGVLIGDVSPDELNAAIANADNTTRYKKNVTDRVVYRENGINPQESGLLSTAGRDIQTIRTIDVNTTNSSANVQTNVSGRQTFDVEVPKFGLLSTSKLPPLKTVNTEPAF